MKIRIGKSFDKETNEVFYQLQFKLDGERTYNAYSYDVFITIEQPKLIRNIRV